MTSSPVNDLHEVSLQALLRAIALRDRKLSLRLLAESPLLAKRAIEVGATRDIADDYYFDEICHYAYAGDTALHIAAAAYQLEIARDLVSRGARVDAPNRRGAQPLHYASDGTPGLGAWDPAAQYAVVKFLIGAGALPNAEDKSGVAPLHRAVRTRCSPAVRSLLEHGAEPRRRNKTGSTPLHLAIRDTGRGGSGDKNSRLEQAEIIKQLLKHGARPSDKDSSGKSVKDCVSSDWIIALLDQA